MFSLDSSRDFQLMMRMRIKEEISAMMMDLLCETVTPSPCICLMACMYRILTYVCGENREAKQVRS